MSTSNLSFIEKLSLLPHVALGLSLGFLRLASRPFTNDVKPPTAFKDFIYTVMRYVLANVTIAQEKWLSQPTETVYLKFAQDNNFEPDTTALSSGVKVHWIGDKTADKVFLYFHGGGYVNSCSPAHFEWLMELQRDLSKKERVAIAVLGYACAPEGQYPLQLRQGAKSLNWLLGPGGKKPEDIFIGGDSAGGNLALGLISHILHPHPKIGDDLRIELPSPLAGAILPSPWIKFPTDDDSVKRNAGSDLVCEAAADRWVKAFQGSAPHDAYFQPLTASADWFSGLDKVVKGIIIWGGEHEILIDSIDAIARRLKDSFPKTEYVRTKGGTHVGWLSNKLLGIKDKDESTQAIESWLAARL